MRKVLISIAAAASALAMASPASAQYFPVRQYIPVPHGYAYGYHNNYGQVRALQSRINYIQHQINRLDSRDIITEREARRLRNESRALEHRLWSAQRYGLHPAESYDVQIRLARLEQRLWRDVNDGRRWGYAPRWY